MNGVSKDEGKEDTVGGGAGGRIGGVGKRIGGQGGGGKW